MITTTIFTPDKLQFTGDAWLRFDTPEDEECNAEANIMFNDNGYFVAWEFGAYVNYTGPFNSYDSASEWLESEGFEDYTSEPITLMKQFCDSCDYHTVEGDCVDHEEDFNTMLDESGDTVTVLGLTFNVSYALKELDPIAYRGSLLDYSNEMVTNGEWFEL